MQVESDRESFAQTHEIADACPLPQVVGDMERKIHDLIGWGLLVDTLGGSELNVPAEALAVAGRAMVEVARDVQIDWERCFALTLSAPASTP